MQVPIKSKTKLYVWTQILLVVNRLFANSTGGKITYLQNQAILTRTLEDPRDFEQYGTPQLTWNIA